MYFFTFSDGFCHSKKATILYFFLKKFGGNAKKFYLCTRYIDKTTNYKPKQTAYRNIIYLRIKSLKK